MSPFVLVYLRSDSRSYYSIKILKTRLAWALRVIIESNTEFRVMAQNKHLVHSSLSSGPCVTFHTSKQMHVLSITPPGYLGLRPTQSIQGDLVQLAPSSLTDRGTGQSRKRYDSTTSIIFGPCKWVREDTICFQGTRPSLPSGKADSIICVIPVPCGCWRGWRIELPWGLVSIYVTIVMLWMRKNTYTFAWMRRRSLLGIQQLISDWDRHNSCGRSRSWRYFWDVLECWTGR